MTATMNRPLPEAIGRKDIQNYGEWLVNNCPPTRGLPSTAIEQRMMNVPMGDDPLSVAVRAHEMVHTKVSPTNMDEWVARGRASIEAMVSAEEARVNFLATKAGFDMKPLFDGSEELTGERLVAMNDWSGAVRMAVGTACSGASKKFLTSVRRHNRVWASVLTDVVKRTEKLLAKHAKRGDLARTDSVYGIAPYGFLVTETIAEWIDRLSEDTPKDKDDNDGSSDDTNAKDGDDDAPKKRGRKPVSADSKEREKEAIEKTRKENPLEVGSDTAIDWFTLKVEKCPMPVHSSGSLGKKRIPSQTGKSPRRIHRLLTDPERRVFDRVVRGKGGVVIVDASGSMRITAHDVRRVVESAPGATVLAYTTLSQSVDENGVPKNANCWVLADNGRMIDTMPFDKGRGNGVDLPALRHALTYRKRSTTPFIWVSDCMVTGVGDGFSEALLLDTLKFVKRNNVIVMPNVEEAINALHSIGKGDTVRSKWSADVKYMVKGTSSDLLT